jgi:hypothetical protein
VLLALLLLLPSAVRGCWPLFCRSVCLRCVSDSVSASSLPSIFIVCVFPFKFSLGVLFLSFPFSRI